MNFGLYSYLSAAIAYAFFTVLLLFSWRESLQGKLLMLVIAASAIWAALAAGIAVEGVGWLEAYRQFEILRYAAWYVFLLKLFDLAARKNEGRSAGYAKFVHAALPVSVGFAGLLLINELFDLVDQPVFGLIGHVFLSLIGLAIIEQLYRNTSVRHRWAMKYLFIGAGGIFAYDFYFYSDTLLFRGVDQELWESRGLVNLVAVPILAIAAARNKNWSLNVFVSRDIVLNTTAIMGGGIYLLIMALAGYYLREFGGTWGQVVQIVFFSLAVVLLAVLLSSVQLRAQAKVFLGKHFYKNKYDYREEWLQLTDSLGDLSQHDDRFKAAIEAMANTVEARAGLLWLRDDRGRYRNVAAWNSGAIDAVIDSEASLINFLDDSGFVVNLRQLNSHANEYADLELPAWLSKIHHPWLIVPLFGFESLMGFVVLANPLVSRSINWEDRDLLKTASKQVATHLAVLLTSDQLAEAKQFEVFTRLSAYMVHDLKNIAAELELISRNAKNHIGNPEFVKDAFDTVDNAAGDIKRLLEQLRNRRAQTEKRVQVDLAELLQKVIDGKQHKLPCPVLSNTGTPCLATVEKDRLANVLAHLIDNAQQATPEDGSVEVTLAQQDAIHVIEIKDSGVGMDADFVRERLFKPFDTTKGNAGMGIGMYESREFIRQLGGDIRVRSEPGKGTIIALQIPASEQYGEVPANA